VNQIFSHVCSDSLINQPVNCQWRSRLRFNKVIDRVISKVIKHSRVLHLDCLCFKERFFEVFSNFLECLWLRPLMPLHKNVVLLETPYFL
jgi:hypothetical protein